MKPYGSICVNLKEKQKKKNHFSPFSLSLSSPTPTLLTACSSFFFFFLFDFPFFLFFFFFLIWIHGSHCAMCPSLIQVCFCLETIYFFSVQFILYELSSSQFPTSEIFLKISSLKSLETYHLENHKNIPIVLEIDETFLRHWISRD